MRRKFTDAEVVTMLLSTEIRQQDLAIEDLYLNLGPTIIRLVMQRKGSREDGEEVISDALCSFLVNVRSRAFELQTNTKISTYVYTLARFTWLKRLRKDKSWLDNKINVDQFWQKDVAQDELVPSERQALFWELVSHLTGKCRALLEAVVAGFTMQEIALMLDMSNADNAKAHKYNCMKKLDALRTRKL